MRVLICGSRHWTNVSSIRRELEALDSMYSSDLTIIQGGCEGADLIAHRLALKLEITSITVPARWKVYKKAAGPIRNLNMITKWKPDEAIAFHEDIHKSKGTKNMVALLRKHGIEPKVVTK